MTAWQAGACSVSSSPASRQLLLRGFGEPGDSDTGAKCIWCPGPSFRRGQFFKLVPLSGNLMHTSLRHALPRLGSGRFWTGPAFKEFTVSWGRCHLAHYCYIVSLCMMMLEPRTGAPAPHPQDWRAGRAPGAGLGGWARLNNGASRAGGGPRL